MAEKIFSQKTSNWSYALIYPVVSPYIREDVLIDFLVEITGLGMIESVADKEIIGTDTTVIHYEEGVVEIYGAFDQEDNFPFIIQHTNLIDLLYAWNDLAIHQIPYITIIEKEDCYYLEGNQKPPSEVKEYRCNNPHGK